MPVSRIIGRKGALWHLFLYKYYCDLQSRIMQPRIYTYKITFEEVPYYYYGSKKEKVFNEEYWGSPVSNKWCWEFYTPKKQILEVFDYTNEGYIKAQEVEGRLIKLVYNTDKWCLNANCLGVFSIEQKRKAGKIGGKIGGKIVGNRAYELKMGIHAMTAKEKREVSLRGVETQRKNNTGIFAITNEQRRENIKKSHETQKKENTGFFGMTKEQKSEAGRKGGSIGGKKAQKTLGKHKLGIYGLTPDERIENGRKGGKISGKKTYENKTGLFSLTEKEKREACKKGGSKSYEMKLGVHARTKEEMSQNGKKIASQKWMCIETGHITNAGALSTFQRKRNIDTKKRIRLE